MYLSVKLLRELLHYDPQTGVFTWKVAVAQCIAIGDVAGGLRTDGYLAIKLAGKSYFAHRLAWRYVRGRWPKKHVDHWNGRRADNRFTNLREATKAQNAQNVRKAYANNQSGFLGVGADKNRWRARIRIDGHLCSLGYFNTPEAAHAAYLAAKRQLHPFNTL